YLRSPAQLGGNFMETPESRAGDSVADAMKQLASDLTILVRDQLEAARREMVEKVKQVGMGAGMLSASVVALVFTAACLTAFATIALALIIPAWLGALIVTLFWAAASGVLAIVGRSKVKNAGPLAPEQTIANLKQDISWAKRQSRHT
ncbi:MAG TPA: phage holin family protein, partial [Candidatus Baltobacteraceae bacterium]|nr:phage holin family protein [Candidatus Baltobacteraceae bacterium]